MPNNLFPDSVDSEQSFYGLRILVPLLWMWATSRCFQQLDGHSCIRVAAGVDMDARTAVRVWEEWGKQYFGRTWSSDHFHTCHVLSGQSQRAESRHDWWLVGFLDTTALIFLSSLFKHSFKIKKQKKQGSSSNSGSFPESHRLTSKSGLAAALSPANSQFASVLNVKTQRINSASSVPWKPFSPNL